MQSDAVCCSSLLQPSVAVCCSIFVGSVTGHCSVLQSCAVCSSVLQCVAVCRIVLQYVAVFAAGVSPAAAQLLLKNETRRPIFEILREQPID